MCDLSCGWCGGTDEGVMLLQGVTLHRHVMVLVRRSHRHGNNPGLIPVTVQASSFLPVTQTPAFSMRSSGREARKCQSVLKSQGLSGLPLL